MVYDIISMWVGERESQRERKRERERGRERGGGGGGEKRGRGREREREMEGERGIEPHAAPVGLCVISYELKLVEPLNLKVAM